MKLFISRLLPLIACSQQALKRLFKVYEEELKQVEVFNYLGRLISFDDANNQVMQSYLKKAPGCWAQVSCVLRAVSASSRMCEMVHKATIQAVLLDRSETMEFVSVESKMSREIPHSLCMANVGEKA
jgi:hypothetical protein